MGNHLYRNITAIAVETTSHFQSSSSHDREKNGSTPLTQGVAIGLK